MFKTNFPKMDLKMGTDFWGALQQISNLVSADVSKAKNVLHLSSGPRVARSTLNRVQSVSTARGDDKRAAGHLLTPPRAGVMIGSVSLGVQSDPIFSGAALSKKNEYCSDP